MTPRLRILVLTLIITSCSSQESRHKSTPIKSEFGGPAVDRLVEYEKERSKDPSTYSQIKYEATLELLSKAELSLRKGDSAEALKLLSIASRYSAYHGRVRSLYALALQYYMVATDKLFNSIQDCSIVSNRVSFLNLVAPDRISFFGKHLKRCSISYKEILDKSSTKKHLSYVEQLYHYTAPAQDKAFDDFTGLGEKVTTILERSKQFPLDSLLKYDVRYLSNIKINTGKVHVSEEVLAGDIVQLYIPMNIRFSSEFSPDICSDYSNVLARPAYRRTVRCWDGVIRSGWGLESKYYKDDKIKISSNYKHRLKRLPIMDNVPIKLRLRVDKGTLGSSDVYYRLNDFSGYMKSGEYVSSVLYPLTVIREKSTTDCSSALSIVNPLCLPTELNSLLVAQSGQRGYQNTLNIYSMQSMNSLFNEQFKESIFSNDAKREYRFYAVAHVPAQKLVDAKSIALSLDVESFIQDAYSTFK